MLIYITKMKMKNKNIWVCALIGITVLWGWSFVAIHFALNEMNASAFNAYRFLVGAGIMGVFLAKRITQMTWLAWRDGAIAGLVLFLAFTFQTIGISYTTASNASFITGLAVIFTPLFAKLLLKVSSTIQQMIGAAMATVGLALLTMTNFSMQYGDFLVLGCALFTALHIVVLFKVSKQHDAALLAFVQVLVVAVLSLIWSFSMGQMRFPQTSESIVTILILGFAGTAVAYYIQTKAQVTAAPSTIAMILVLEPVFGGIFGYFLAGDRLSTLNLIGAFLIVLAMCVTELKLPLLSKK